MIPNRAVSPATFLLRIESLRLRARRLTGLRAIVGLKPHQDIQPEQWEALENQLAAVSNRLLQQLRVYTDNYLSEYRDRSMRYTLMNRLGEMELEIGQAYNFYDTFVDLLTQRLSDDIGPLLKGCDVIAADGLNRGFLAEITAAPLVYCDRGFGAKMLRQGVCATPHTPNPVPLIGIPYSRLIEKYNLMSIYHEVGHQALAKLNLTTLLQRVTAEAVARAGASPLLQRQFGLWSRELAPDFWAFGLTGMAQTASIRDVLVLPHAAMFHVSPHQQHPPAYLRFLASVAWCRLIWGQGDWDVWAEEWQELYPLQPLDPVTRQNIAAATRVLDAVARALITTRFKKLDGKPLAALFNFDTLQPGRLKALASKEALAALSFRQHPLGVQLAAFRLMREKRLMKLPELDTLMTQWITQLPTSSLLQKN